MSCVIQILSWMINRPCDIADQYIAWVDVQRYVLPTDFTQPASVMVQDWLWTTPDITQAHCWKDRDTAIKAYREIPASMPKRYDGKPNRPLTAFHVNFEAVPLPEGSIIKEGKQ